MSENGVAPGAIALVGSGEYLPVMDDVDRVLLDTLGGPALAHVVVIPTASGLEPGMPEQWNARGVAHFRRLGAQVGFQEFTARNPLDDTTVPMANMIVTWNPESTRRVIFCTHYDTRPIADREPNRRDWTKPFLSANDGASGVAWMMELAHQMNESPMKDMPSKIGVDFILFDGEEYIFESGRDKYFIGSDYFAAEWKKDKPKHKYIAGVLLDLFTGVFVMGIIIHHISREFASISTERLSELKE